MKVCKTYRNVVLAGLDVDVDLLAFLAFGIGWSFSSKTGFLILPCICITFGK